jgi:hypothetical protein
MSIDVDKEQRRREAGATLDRKLAELVVEDQLNRKERKKVAKWTLIIVGGLLCAWLLPVLVAALFFR